MKSSQKSPFVSSPPCAAASAGRIDGGLARQIATRYAERLEPLSDSRGSAEFRRRVVAVEVRRALEALAAGEGDEVGEVGE